MPLLLWIGCAPAISKPVLETVDPNLSLNIAQQDVNRHIGKTVLWNGTILKATNTSAGTVLEVLQKPADSAGKPRNVDISEGRFLAIYEGYLDVAIYSPDRKVSVAGVIQTAQVRPLGQIDYVYPYLKIREIHLWPKEVPTEIIWVEPIEPYFLRRAPYHRHHRPRPKSLPNPKQ